ncbi:mechanosensitive ion channel domain-containing protein [Asticcacaulis sp. EMRT-3]|uniref:mechanosensitive ion channel family protein n=1 Tax=Asticcacaulis sp. EMRT-3 TaxID=3040349 RepID=UPI0024AE8887|nr:mechanosensitive ion channel domain-containing protein [Asticcacaulis sp. EMRT-3]MDI7773857.1 mechanosensitive ion channel [Asticcacaulis sp. EMRT-3]
MNLLAMLNDYNWPHLAERAVMGLIVIALAFVGARVASHLFQRARARARTVSASIYVFEKLVSYGLILLGFMLALSVSGINITSLAVFAGALGVGVGLGLQGIVKEFVSGLVIIFDPHLDIGDFIQIDEARRGEIMEIGPRATRLRTNDGMSIVIPNSALIENQVINWTFKGATRRIHVPFGVAYGVDKAKVRECVLQAARGVSFTLPDTDQRRTQVWLTGFGDNSLNFELVVWPTPESVRRPASLMAAYNWAIEDALRAEGIEIPFPQRDLHVRSLFGLTEEDALKSLGLKSSQTKKPEAILPSTNDAARDLHTELPPEETELKKV